MTEPMNPAQIAAMVADLEAGTPGKWAVGFREDGSSYLSIGGLEPGQVHSQGDIFFHTDYPRDIANARRIARVPDLEVTIIAQAAEIARLTAECGAFQGNATRNYELWCASEAKVAALTDALDKVCNLTCEAIEDDDGNSGCGQCADECTGCIAYAAITMKGEAL